MNKRIVAMADVAWSQSVESFRRWHNTQRSNWPSFMVEAQDAYQARRVTMARLDALAVLEIIPANEPSLAAIANEGMRHPSGFYL